MAGQEKEGRDGQGELQLVKMKGGKEEQRSARGWRGCSKRGR